MRKTDVFVVAIWSALGLGIVEGLALNIARAFPALAAPYKFSAHILWVAPVLNTALFLLVAAVLIPLLRRLRKWLPDRESMFVLGVFIFLGLFGIISAPKLTGSAPGALLALGLAVTLLRKMSGAEARLIAGLRRRLFLVPPIILLLVLGVAGYEKAAEWWRADRLPAARAGAPNVLLIVMDTVRYDSFVRSAAGSLTPNLDRMAAQGVRFENAWSSSSWTLPSQTSILTGLYPYQHGADWPSLKLDATRPTLGTFLSEQGYATGAFSGNSAWITPEYVGRGFLRFDTYIMEDFLRRTSYGRMLNVVLRNLRLHESGRGKPAAQINAQLLRFVDAYKSRPFFAYVCYMDVNRTFHNRWLNYGFLQHRAPLSEVKQAYDVGLMELDEQIGALFAELEQSGVLQNTLVVITSDHGESFGTGNGDHNPIGHGTSLYPEQTRVPLFIVFPGHIAAGSQNPELVSIRQIPGTIADLLQTPSNPFPDPPLSLSRQTPGQSSNNTQGLLMTLNYSEHNLTSVLWDGWQYIHDQTTTTDELYNLVSDPPAKRNLASEFDLTPAKTRLKDLMRETRPVAQKQ